VALLCLPIRLPFMSLQSAQEHVEEARRRGEVRKCSSHHCLHHASLSETLGSL
jgi:hypothetical protein